MKIAPDEDAPVVYGDVDSAAVGLRLPDFGASPWEGDAQRILDEPPPFSDVRLRDPKS